MYNPFIFKLNSGNSDILLKHQNDNIKTSSTINLPLSSLGFHTFIHRTKSAMSITNNLQSKTKFYYIVNPFEIEIDNYEDSLNNLTKKYLNITDDKPNILSNSFYKMWEMLFLFDLDNSKELVYASIEGSSQSFIQAVILFREKLGNGVSNDKIFSIPVNSQKGEYIEMGKQFLGYYNDIHPGLINTKSFKGKKQTDITNIKNISSFKTEIKKTKQYADLITADGEFMWDENNFQEQEGYKLILGEIVCALNVQAKDGNFVIKVFESFTIPTIKLLYILSSFYEETYIYKPLFSRPIDSERYFICKKFKYDWKKDTTLLNNKIKSLENSLEEMNTLSFIRDIYSELIIPQSFINKIRFINIKITTPQQIMINEIVKYIKENNYFGDKYHTFKEGQINATKWWINNFFPPSKNLLEKNKDDLKKMVEAIINKYNLEEEKFTNNLIY
jgi:hypothetical protein